MSGAAGIAAPADAAAWGALALALVLAAVPRSRRLFEALDYRAFVTVAAGLAALLSGAYVAYYLRGGPRIIDATSYYLEARSLSEGHLAWQPKEPSASVAGRFLLRDGLASGDRLAVIFPPGYPAVLALGFLVRAPMIVGPLLAASATLATGFLARTALAAEQHDVAAKLAVALSVVCGVLRYHTADTMSHGLSACLVAVALGCALEIRGGATDEKKRRRSFLGCGAALGLLVCTRPASGLAVSLLVLLVLARDLDPKGLGAAAVAAAPFLALLVLHQRAATGGLASSQTRYYAVSDGPPGCFDYGVGGAIGCGHEHGDFVRRYMPSGFDAKALLGTTGRRLAMHASDAMNAWPFVALLVLAIGWAIFRGGNVRLLALLIAAQIAVYAPFYFDGNYPGGGARFFADVLPAEHVLLAWLIVDRAVAASPAVAALGASRVAAIAIALSIAGFALFGHASHEALRDREGGRPMFEPRVVRAAGIGGGVLFVGTDHGFALAYDADATASPTSIEALRLRGDALDYFAWTERGRPPSFAYRFDASSGAAFVEPYTPAVSDRVEAENLWPAFEQRGASALPSSTQEPCASSGRWLAISTFVEGAEVRLSLPRALGGLRIRPVVAARGSFQASIDLVADGRAASTWEVRKEAAPTCEALDAVEVPRAQRLELRIRAKERAETGLFALDAIRIDDEGPRP